MAGQRRAGIPSEALGQMLPIAGLPAAAPPQPRQHRRHGKPPCQRIRPPHQEPGNWVTAASTSVTAGGAPRSSREQTRTISMFNTNPIQSKPCRSTINRIPVGAHPGAITRGSRNPGEQATHRLQIQFIHQRLMQPVAHLARPVRSYKNTAFQNGQCATDFTSSARKGLATI